MSTSTSSASSSSASSRRSCPRLRPRCSRGEPEPDRVQRAAGPVRQPRLEDDQELLLIGTRDRVLPPAEQLAMAERADGVVVQHKADHLSMLETPQQVTM